MQQPRPLHCSRHGKPMSYQYLPLRFEEHRDVAHWRGARGGVRVLNVPTCAGWLQRQANDASYDFWPDLAIGTLMRAPAEMAPAGNDQAADSAAALFVMQQDPDGAWFIDPWRADHAGDVRPVAANGEHADPVAPVSRSTHNLAPIESHCDSVHGTSFIIEIAPRRG